MKRGAILLFLAILAVGCYPDGKGKNLEQKVSDLEAFVAEQADWNAKVVDRLQGTGDTEAPAVVKLRDQVRAFCEGLTKDADECKKAFDGGPGDGADEPVVPTWPRGK